jgi:hypothetical protein
MAFDRPYAAGRDCVTLNFEPGLRPKGRRPPPPARQRIDTPVRQWQRCPYPLWPGMAGMGSHATQFSMLQDSKK